METQNALWELAAAGLAAADGFDQLRAMIDPERRLRRIHRTESCEARRGGGRCSAHDTTKFA